MMDPLDRPPELATTRQAQEIQRLNLIVAMTAGRPILTSFPRNDDEAWQFFQIGYTPEALQPDFNELFPEPAILGVTALKYNFHVNARTDLGMLTQVNEPGSLPDGRLLSLTTLGCEGRLPDGKRNRWSIVYSVRADQAQDPPYGLLRHQGSQDSRSIEITEALRRDPEMLSRFEVTQQMRQEVDAAQEDNDRQEAAGLAVVSAHEADIVITVLEDVLDYIMERNNE